jgi:hypothetical protein
VEDRYYSKEEYNKLTAEQKEALCHKRSKRGHKPGAKTSKVLLTRTQRNKRPANTATKCFIAISRHLPRRYQHLQRRWMWRTFPTLYRPMDPRTQSPLRIRIETTRLWLDSKPNDLGLFLWWKYVRSAISKECNYPKRTLIWTVMLIKVY